MKAKYEPPKRQTWKRHPTNPNIVLVSHEPEEGTVGGICRLTHEQHAKAIREMEPLDIGELSEQSKKWARNE